MESTWKTPIDLIMTARENRQGLHTENVKDMACQEGIKCQNVSFSYANGMKIFQRINMTCEHNKCTIIKGSNGTGKSTLLKILLKYISPSDGVIINNYPPPIGFSSASASDVNSFLKCGSIIQDCLGKRESPELEEALKILQLHECQKQRFLKLSSGQKKKLSLFRSLIIAKKCVFLDEPLSHLDETSQNYLRLTLEKLKQAMTIVLVMHTDAFDSMADSIYNIQNYSILKKK